MFIIDVGEYVDLVRLSKHLSKNGVSNPNVASSFIAEEVCIFYMSDTVRLRGGNFIIKPKPRSRAAFKRAHDAGMLSGGSTWPYMHATLPDNFFRLDGLDHFLTHTDIMFRPKVATPINPKPIGMVKVELRG